MKAIKFFGMLAAVGVLGFSCTGNDEDDPTPDPSGTVNFVVKADKNVIRANGEDAVQFTATADGSAVAAANIVAYNAATNAVIDMPGLKFTTTTEGTYTFRFAYGSNYSEVFTVIAVDPDMAIDLEVKADKTSIQADGEDAVQFTVFSNGSQLAAADVVAYDAVTNNEVSMPGLKFTTTTAGTYMFWFSSGSSRSDIISIKAEAPTLSGDFVVKADKSIFQADGEDAVQFIATVGGQRVTDGVIVYDASTNKEVSMPDLKFVTTTAGVYSFWFSYGISYTDPISVQAIASKVPELPEDPEPDNTSFARRMLFTQFTGTGCGYCPMMTVLMREFFADAEADDLAVLAVAHQYNADDPAYLSGGLYQSVGVTGFPALILDLGRAKSNYTVSASALKSATKELIASSPAKAGLAVSSDLSGNSLTVRVVLKAAETQEYRVGVWVLEDGIYGKQANYNNVAGDFNTHNNCVRVADSRVSNTNFTGHTLGEVKAGQTAERLFTIDLDSKWVKENLHLIVFESTPEPGGKYYVNNAIGCNIGEMVGFEYAK